MKFRYQHRARDYEITFDGIGGSGQATIDGRQITFDILESQPGVMTIRAAGCISRIYYAAGDGGRWFSMDGCTFFIEEPKTRRSRSSSEVPGRSQVSAPMPAQVRSVLVENGDHVQAGQTLLLLEAMKMEIRIKAPADGMVENLKIQAGQTVTRSQNLLEIQSEASEST